jgi:hypothetical protein
MQDVAVANLIGSSKCRQPPPLANNQIDDGPLLRHEADTAGEHTP